MLFCWGGPSRDGRGHVVCRSLAGRGARVGGHGVLWPWGLFVGIVGIAGRGFVSVSGDLRSTKMQQRQFAWGRNLRAVALVHAVAPASYHRQRVLSLRASPGGVLVACGAELGRRSARSGSVSTESSDGSVSLLHKSLPRRTFFLFSKAGTENASDQRSW
jgi:hypothetical protein